MFGQSIKTVAFNVSMFDGVIKNRETGEETSVDDSCKLTILSGKYNDTNIRASEDSISEKYGREVAQYKITKEQFDQLKDLNFPVLVDLNVDYVNNKMNVLSVNSVQEIDIVAKKAQTTKTA